MEKINCKYLKAYENSVSSSNGYGYRSSGYKYVP